MEALARMLEAGALDTAHRQAGPATPLSDVEPSLTLDDLGEAVARMRSGLLGEARPGDPNTRGLQARRHADLDAAILEAVAAILDRDARRQRTFLQDISHDMRSPLNSILFLADALRSEHSGPLNRVQARQVEILFMAAATLVKMVNDVIDFARLGGDASMRCAMLPFSLETVVSDVERLVGPVVAHNEVELRLDVRACGLRTGDAQIVNRVLLNLASNAVQALPEGGTVDVRLSDGEDGDLCVDVVDSGRDAPIEKIRAALDVDDPDRLTGETRGWTHGLGLSISARLVRAAGGSIEVRSSPEGGAEFSVRLPFPAL